MPRQTKPEAEPTAVEKSQALELARHSAPQLEVAIDSSIQRGITIMESTGLTRLELLVGDLVVTEDHELQTANSYLTTLKDGRALLSSHWDAANGLKKTFHALHGLVCQYQNAGLSRYDRAIDKVAGLMAPFMKAKEDAAKAEQKRIADEAEKARKEMAKRAQEEAMRGNVKVAARMEQAAKSMPTPVLPVQEIQLPGTSTRRPWEVTVESRMDLIKAIAAGEVPDDVIKEFDISLMQKRAAAMNGLAYPGVKAVQGIALARSR